MISKSWTSASADGVEAAELVAFFSVPSLARALARSSAEFVTAEVWPDVVVDFSIKADGGAIDTRDGGVTTVGEGIGWVETLNCWEGGGRTSYLVKGVDTA